MKLKLNNCFIVFKMLNNKWSRNVFHNINIECIRLGQPAVHDICNPLNGHLMHYISVEYCPILQAKIRGVWSDLLQCFHAYISAVLAYPKHVLLWTWPVTIHNRNVILLDTFLPTSGCKILVNTCPSRF